MHENSTIELAGSLVVVIATAAALSVLAAIGAAVARKWVVVRRCVLALVVSILGTIPVSLLLLSGLGTSSESKATSLARGIAEAMNFEAVALPVLLVALACWVVMKRRARGRVERGGA